MVLSFLLLKLFKFSGPKTSRPVYVVVRIPNEIEVALCYDTQADFNLNEKYLLNFCIPFCSKSEEMQYFSGGTVATATLLSVHSCANCTVLPLLLEESFSQRIMLSTANSPGSRHV